LSSFNTVSGNNIIANNFGVGLSFSSYNVLSENNIAESVWSGVELDSSSYNVVSKNKIDNIALFTSTFNVISNNVISDGVGLYYSSDSNTVARNNITNAGPGVRISESSNNRIFHNNFIDNIPQVISATSLNFWDNGYPSGGNYWSDYVGSDLYHGFYQNESGSDGKGDTPYVIDANNSDRYPLVQPYKLLIGDLNGDDQVNMMDISVVAKAFGSMPRHPRWNPIADIDKDGYVDMRDVSVVAKNFGKIG
jgi:parallel beta-helix repeat protein